MFEDGDAALITDTGIDRVIAAKKRLGLELTAKAARGRRFGTILAGPPWPFQNRSG